MKKILILLLAITFNVFAQGEGDRIINPFWKLSSGALSPTVSTWTLTLPATTFSPSIVTPLIIGGTGTTSTLTYKTTTANGIAGARHIFLVGNNGGTEAMTILNDGKVGIGTTGPGNLLEVVGASKNVVFRGGAAETTDARFEFNNFGGVGGNRRLVFTASAPSIQALTTSDGSVQSLFLNPSGGNVGIGNIAPGSKLEVTGKVAVQNQSAIAGTITSDYSVVYPYDDGSNVKVMALLDDAGTETTTQVATANMWGEPSGGAILNGTTQYYSHANNASLNFGTGDFSIEVYFKTSNVAYGYLAGKRDGTNGYDFLVNTNGNLRMTIYGASATNDYITTTQVADGIWHYVVAKISDANITLYKDGSLIGTQTSAITPGDVTDPFYVGQRSGSALPLNGVISFVRVNNHALTQSEVTKRWNNGQPHLFVEPYATKGASNSNIVTNGTFTGSSTGWTEGTGWAYGTNNEVFTATGSYSSLEQSCLTTGKTYKVSIDVTVTAGAAYMYMGSNNPTSTTMAATATYTATGTATNTTFAVQASPTFAGTVDNVVITPIGGTFSIANTDWGASGAVCTIGGTKSIANSTAYPIAVSGKYDARKTIAANYEFTGTAKVGSILKYVKITNTIAGPDTISLGTSALGTQVINAQIIGATSTVIVNVDKWFSDSATQSLFLSGVNWAADNLEVVLIYEPIGEKL